MADWLSLNADFHMHGLYSGAVSGRMVPEVIAAQAPLKGLKLVGSADALHSKWLALLKEQLQPAEGGLLQHSNGTKIILQTEVEDVNRVHHLILFPEFSKVEEVREQLAKVCGDLDADGRPKLRIGGEELLDICVPAGCLVGFAHAFTPYFGLYGKYSSYKDCYGDQAKNIHFLELGLSADTAMADQISELHDLTFTSNSDAHSPWPNKLGREFNTLQIKELTFDEIAKALKREGGRSVARNVGFNPLEGKYHKTRCTGCLAFYEPKSAASLRWRCPDCKKSIKKGVDFRISELADRPLGDHPQHRPPYTHIVPLSEIIALSKGVKNSWSEKVQLVWQRFVDVCGNEITALLETPISDLAKIESKVAESVQHFREGKINYLPGGAGVYGKLLPPGEDPKKHMKVNKDVQKRLEF